MKTIIFRTILLATLLFAQPSFAQNQDFVSTVLLPGTTNIIRSQNASFPNITEYINNQLYYPELARKNGVEGVVTVEATISESGEVVFVGLLDSLGFGCDQVVIELVSNMPKWKPAIKNGQRVVQKVLIRAHFQLK